MPTAQALRPQASGLHGSFSSQELALFGTGFPVRHVNPTWRAAVDRKPNQRPGIEASSCLLHGSQEELPTQA
jgi:hypothetical protein